MTYFLLRLHVLLFHAFTQISFIHMKRWVVARFGYARIWLSYDLFTRSISFYPHKKETYQVGDSRCKYEYYEANGSSITTPWLANRSYEYIKVTPKASIKNIEPDIYMYRFFCNTYLLSRGGTITGRVKQLKLILRCYVWEGDLGQEMRYPEDVRSLGSKREL